ncbi:hypothetical protein [Bremerella alba]|uniref:Uncharacterized protein n=1 Tax=Bremerella alba TaxID=980252 RepID=A0A7V9A6A5_9BACT|nr:hypothetical protein [Bremerella alba]MBA2114083.1 hypothetical protein [Bremerella alba]
MSNQQFQDQPINDGFDLANRRSSAIGNVVIGYTTVDGSHVTLRKWCGLLILDCRHQVVEQYRDGTFALLFRLTRGRYIVGYATGNGKLFRGELFKGTCEEAKQLAQRKSSELSSLDRIFSNLF